MTSSIRNPDGLIAIVSNFFGVPAQIDECVGRWVRLPDQMQCRMSESPRTGTISRSLVMGRRYWDCGSVIRIVLGPLSLDDYMRLLPGGESSRVLRDWVVSYLGPEYECEVQLKLAADQVPRMKFGANRMHLGWNSWFRVGAIREDRGDLIYRLTDPDQSEEVG
jgi:type VI secretion system protein ImpH